MEETLIALLLATPALTALTGSRIYWLRFPQSGSARPYIVLQRIDGVQSYEMSGISDHVASRIQADVYAETYKSSKQVSRQLIATLSGFSGGIFQGIFIDSQRDLPATDAGEVTALFRTSVDFIIHHNS